jgi:predicted site-specific integrase-resolvase
MKDYVGGKKASEILGVHQRTLYQWEEKGLIDTIRSPGGKRFYNVRGYMKNTKDDEDIEQIRLRICYVRVSSNSQRDDLKRQKKYMKKKFPNHLIIQDIGSGINMNRKGLNRIIDLAIDGKVKEVVVAYKDRLTRFGYDMIERIIQKYSYGKIKVLNTPEHKEPQEELMEDVLQIMNVFTAKMNGLRKYNR